MTTPRTYHHGNLRAALIEAGLAALEKSEQGELSLRAIARDVGVSANAAYRHFANKDDLLSALAAEGFRRFAAGQARAMQAGDADTAATKMSAAGAKAYVGFAQANPALFRLMFSHFLYASESADLKEASTAAFQSLLETSARQAGVPIDSQQALLAALANWSTVHGLSHLLLDGQLSFFEMGVSELIDGIIALRAPAR